MVLWSDKTITEFFDNKQWGWVKNLMKKNKTKTPYSQRPWGNELGYMVS